MARPVGDAAQYVARGGGQVVGASANASVSLNQDQQAAVDAALEARSIIITGSAGVGNSLLVTHIVRMRKRMPSISPPPVVNPPSQVWRRAELSEFVKALQDFWQGVCSNQTVKLLKRCERPLAAAAGVLPTILYPRCVDIDRKQK